MRDALVDGAAARRDELRAQAGRDAELIVREAEARAREIIHKAYAEREQVRREVERCAPTSGSSGRGCARCWARRCSRCATTRSSSPSRRPAS